MKTTALKINFRFILMTIVVIMMTFTFNSCGKKAVFAPSSYVPAATGQVKVKKDRNNNYITQIEVTNLAKASMLSPPKNTYVVWMESDNNPAVNLGQLKSSSAFLSKTLRASFETVSTTKPDKIFITAEDDAEALYPSHIMLTTNIF